MRKVFLIFSISSLLISESIFPVTFSSDIEVIKSGELISQSKIIKNENNFIYKTDYPYSQSVYIVDDNIYIQDDDFKQVSKSENLNIIPIMSIFKGEYDFESYECNSSICFLNITPIDGVSSLVIVKDQDQIKEVSYFSLDYQSYKLKFKNFLMETVKINYMPPEGYEFIEYD